MKSLRNTRNARGAKNRKAPKEIEAQWLEDDDGDENWPEESVSFAQTIPTRADLKQLRTRKAIETALENLALRAAMEDFPEYRILN